MSGYRLDDRRTDSATSSISEKVDKDNFPFELSKWDGSEYGTVALIRSKSEARFILDLIQLKEFTKTYRQEIEQFFQGTLPSSTYSKEKGKVRIVNHDNMETLQVEPADGGQYELAVRVPRPETHTKNMGYDYEHGDKYHGYIASNGYIWGRNTGGH